MASTSLVISLYLFVFCGGVLAAVPTAQEVIHVTVYFESYCPDSVKFLTQQLYPVYLSPLGDYMNITLVPYGKATTTKTETGEYMFSCHHGDKECRGNKVIGCVLHEKDTSFADQLKFINCTSSTIAANTKREEYPVRECATGSNVKADMLLSCAGDRTGSEYLAEYGNITNELSPPLSSIPSVLFNEKFMDSENKMAVSNFRSALCSKITGKKPAECTKSGAVTLQTAILPVVAALMIVSRI